MYANLVLPLRRMYQNVYYYDSHYHSSILGGNDLMLLLYEYMTAACVLSVVNISGAIPCMPIYAF